MTQTVTLEPVSYTDAVKQWLADSGHYLDNPPPGCLFAVAARWESPGLFGPVGGEMAGLLLVGRPVARGLPQDGTVGEVTRLVLSPGVPYGTASRMLRYAAALAKKRGIASLISYHDRTMHTGCIYKKAGFRKAGVVQPRRVGWGSRDGRVSAGYMSTPKRRWVLDLTHGGQQ